MSTTQNDRLRELVEPLAAERGMDLEDLTLAQVGSRRVLTIVVDTDEGVQLDECAELSHAVSELLDRRGALGDVSYVLEVTSPGVDRPLTERRHFERSLDRMVHLQLSGGGTLTARVRAVDDEGLDLEVPGEKGRRPKQRRVAFAEIDKARGEVDFARGDSKQQQ
ncbi:ribosome maturation factor RimP [Streptomyces aidingensis]|uniref:Ribosome maturation factor RimP n=1 Tax=Streptomyces aidingensis TaxID=910347 RepID=A0A1I1P4N8_9ACTN|nr:ribosome maturation factor RimP [Streptomyces aidingensis]SFD02648.1 ribosome maturation factor RimP [Streptomyces aidingensis]